MSGPVVIIIIGAPPPPPKGGRSEETPAVGNPTIADQLRDAADVLDGKD
jgi:hypothetical protein